MSETFHHRTDREIIMKLQERVKTLEAERADVIAVLGDVDPHHPHQAIIDARTALGLGGVETP